jgi:hypothetical protein
VIPIHSPATPDTDGMYQNFIQLYHLHMMKIALIRKPEKIHHPNYSNLVKKTRQINTFNWFQFSPLDSAQTRYIDSSENKPIPRKL